MTVCMLLNPLDLLFNLLATSDYSQARESLVSDIPAAGRKNDNPFLQSSQKGPEISVLAGKK
jgi:hypothetical protein